MDVTESADSEPEVYFVFCGPKETSLRLFDEAFQACRDSEIEPKKLSTEDCLQLTLSARNDIFVLDSFDNEVYVHLQSHNARIYGAPCVLHCLRNSEDLPEEDHPVYSMCMSGALVTFTGVPTADRPVVVKRLGWLGATFTKGLVKSTTHLIAQEASSKKYQAAVGLKIPILTLDWLTDSLEKSKTSLFDAKDSHYISKYNCPVFLGCVITTSNIVEKNKIKEIVERGGGKYSGQMAFKECTHLIIERPEGQKYTMAQKWGSVRIVSPLWVYDCDRIGYRLPEDQMSKYSIRKASTPSKEEFKSPNPPDVSAIHSSTFSVSHIDETRTSMNNTSSTTTGSRKSAEGNDSSPTRTCAALAGCKVCIRGFDDKTTESLTSLITHCGGTRSLSTVQADYIVISQLDDDTRQHIKSIRQPVVSSEWLKNVHTAQTLVDVERYLLYKPSKKRRNSVDDILPVPKSTKLSTDESLSGDQTMLDTELLNNGDDQLLSQYGGGAEAAANTASTSKDESFASANSTVTGDFKAPTAENALTPTINHHSDLHLPFQGLRFTIDPQVSVKERDAVAIMIRSHGGTITDSDGVVHFLVMPLILKQKTEPRSTATLASTVWVRACDRVCRLLPVESNSLFTPVFCTNHQCLSGCVVTTTGLSAPERDAICGLMATAGGRYFEDLRKLPGALLPATTHLVCESTESAKYKAARNWGLNIISISWLTDSLKAGVCQPIEPYHPLKVKASKEATEKRTLASLQTPVHSRIQALKLGQTSSSQKKGSSKQYLSTSILDEPDKPFQPKFDMSCFDTPGGGPKQPTSNTPGTPLDVAMEKYMQIAVSKHCVPTPDLTSSSHVLAGCIVCLSKKLSSQSEQLSKLVTSLGGQFRSGFDVKATHLIFQGKATDAEYRSAKRANQLIVCPLWIDKCVQEKKKVAESLYPYNYKEDRALQAMENGTPSCRSEISTQSGPLRNRTSSYTQSNSVGTEASEETQTSTAETLQVYKQIKDYMSKRKTDSNQSRKSMTDMSAVTTPGAETSIINRPKETQVFQSQNDMLVTWDDITSRGEPELEGNVDSDLDSEVMAQMDEDFTQEREANKPPTSQDMSSDYTLDGQDQQMETSVKDDSILQPPRVFQFSGFKDEERDEIAEKLKSLGEKVLVESNFDVECTHLILQKPQRNEKFLCSLVRGLWVLNRSFVDASIQQGKLVSEVSHEWGNPKAAHPVNGAAAPYADACHRRRLAAQSGQEAPIFSSWKVILSLSKDKTASMKKILELGGAEVISTSGLPQDTAQISHAFVEVKKSTLSREDIQCLEGKGVQCVKVEYIPACLINPSTAHINKFPLYPNTAKSTSSSPTLRKSTRQRSKS